jgi:hypothetical protein
MAIPFLPSLLSRAFASDPATGAVPKRFISVNTSMGEVWGQNMYPDDALLTQNMNYAGRVVRYGALPHLPDANGKVVWSPSCTASASLLTPALAAKFNIIRGLDIPYNLGHNFGCHLGNFAANSYRSTAGINNTAYLMPTIDQMMAHSPSFYTQDDLDTKMTQRAFGVSSGKGAQLRSWNYSSVATKSGEVTVQPVKSHSRDLYNHLFKPASTFHNIDAVLIDRVKESYDVLKQDPRLSIGDRNRLNQHVERMFEIERKLQVSNAMGEGLPTEPGEDHYSDSGFFYTLSQQYIYCDVITDVIVAALSTGVSRVGSWSQEIHFIDEAISDWHGSVSHCALGASISQLLALNYNQATFEHAFVQLAAKLDAVTMEDGSTLLDNSLMMLTNEAGQLTHQSSCVNYPVVTAGGAGGYFNTGMFVDFSDQTKIYGSLNSIIAEKPGINPEGPGLYYQQFLANALMSMGIPASEWEHCTDFTAEGPDQSEPTKGYGFHYVDPNKAVDYAQAKLVMSDKLPVITSS